MNVDQADAALRRLSEQYNADINEVERLTAELEKRKKAKK